MTIHTPSRRPFPHLARRLLAVAALVGSGLGAALSPAVTHAADAMVSIKGSVVNMRDAPSTSSNVLFKLAQGFPLKVIERKGDWLQVEDFENDRGWVSAPWTQNVAHHIVKGTLVNVRRGPGTEHPVVGQAKYGEIARTLGSQGDWVKVSLDGLAEGWVERSLLWGW
jgi:SH3-like domain-containing protein